MAGVPLPPGAMIAHYEIESVLGAGGFGITYRAIDRNSGELVAIKEYFPSSAAVRDEDGSVLAAGIDQEQTFRRYLGRFWEEAETLNRFCHPQIVRVVQRLFTNSTAYIVLEYLPGPSLEQWAQTSPELPSQEALETFTAALLDALETIHSATFLHRDLAPKNVLLREDGLPVLIDFGSSRALLPSQNMTALVTANYAPHEQYLTSGRGQGAWTDIYSASATIYRLLAGRPPMDAATRVLDDSTYQPLETLLAGRYRRSFLKALDWGLAVYPNDRPQSVAAWRGPLLEGTSVVRGATGLRTLSTPVDRRPIKDRIRDMLNLRTTYS